MKDDLDKMLKHTCPYCGDETVIPYLLDVVYPSQHTCSSCGKYAFGVTEEIDNSYGSIIVWNESRQEYAGTHITD